MAPVVFSIIIPSFNSASTIGATLESIAAQSFRGYEIIVMDGGSSDSTIDIVKDFYPGRENVRLTSEKDQGIYDAMNKGIRLAKGEWLYFLGSDDLLAAPDVLEKINAFALSKPADVIYGDIIRKSNGGTFGGTFDLERLQMKHNICHQAIFYRKGVFEKLGNYNLKYKVWADWEFNIRCFRHTELNCEYVNLSICLFNDITGLSSKETDPVFAKELPKFYMQKMYEIEGSLGYRIGNKISKLLKPFRRKGK